MLQWLREQGSCYLADSDSVHSDADADSDWKSCIIAVNAAPGEPRSAQKKMFAELNDRFFNYNRYNSKMTKINKNLLLELYGLYLQYQHLIPIFFPNSLDHFVYY